MRLTEKDKQENHNFLKPINTSIDFDFEARIKADDKLGQLEDIEDELGVDLITLFQAILLKGIYVRCGRSFEHIPPKDLWLRTDVKPHIIDFKQSDQPHYLKDYGKTWALTKGELQEP